MTEAGKEYVVLDRLWYICYLIYFKKNKIQASIDLGSKVNAITPKYTSKLDFQICRTNIRVQKIDGSTFKTFEIVLASF